MSGEQLLRAFEECNVPADSFRHREHVEVAWLYLSRHSLLVALTRFVDGIKRLAASYGALDKYHETITWAYIFLVHERMHWTGRRQTWSEFEASNPDLFAWPSPILAKYYCEETLSSDLAKKVFLLPDQAATSIE